MGSSANRNATVVEILKYGYEFGRSIARPEVPADWFQEAVYVPTLLDSELLPRILEDEYDLVLLTGNPGDGKSAFLSRLMGTSTNKGREVRVLHDATEPSDSDNRAATALDSLITFVTPVLEAQTRSGAVFVVGINKGLLVRGFLAPQAPLRSPLGELIEQSVEANGFSEGPPRIALVDLNLRSEATLPVSGTDDLFAKLLDRITDPVLWEANDTACGSCDASDWCPLLANANLLREPIVRERLKLLWLIQQFRSDRHATMRDLWATLSYLVVGHEDMYRGQPGKQEESHPCSSVERDFADEEPGNLFRRIIYNSTFIDDDLFNGNYSLIADPVSPRKPMHGMAPRVVSQYLNSLDPAAHSFGPWFDLEENVLSDPLRYLDSLLSNSSVAMSGVEKAVLVAIQKKITTSLTELDDLEPSSAEYGRILSSYDSVLLVLLDYAKRRSFFSGDMAIDAITGFRSLGVFLGALEYAGSAGSGLDEWEMALLGTIPRGLVRSDGLALDDDSSDALRVRWSETHSDVAAVLVMNPIGALLLGEPQVAHHPFVEASPEYLVYKPFAGSEEKGPSFHVTLDTFEGLHRMALGYSSSFVGVPKARQIKNFRAALRSWKASDLRLVSADQNMNEVRATLTPARIRFK